jgi:hypothetical protein
MQLRQRLEFGLAKEDCRSCRGRSSTPDLQLLNGLGSGVGARTGLSGVIAPLEERDSCTVEDGSYKPPHVNGAGPVIREPTVIHPERPTAQPIELEVRVVRVSEPGLSNQANDLLTREVREVVGRDHVLVAHDRPQISRSETPRVSHALTALHDNRVIVGMIVPAGIVIVAIVGLSIGRWWLLPPATAILLLATYSVVSLVFSLEAGYEQPSPTTVALLEEEGVRNPERLFSDVVKEFAEDWRAGQS